MKTAIVVQARTGSTRLPGKTLKPLAGHTVIEEVLRRCAAVPGADIVVCAIPNLSEDDALIPLAERAKAVVVRGSANDVLSRYLKAAESVAADIIMRVTSDCPLIDPGVCGDLLKLRSEKNADYASNNMPASFPHGLDAEVFTIEALRKADKASADPYNHEHVTPWLREAPEISRASLIGPGGMSHRWTLDHPEDYEFFTRIFALLPSPPAIPPWTEVLKIVEANPEIAKINTKHQVSH